MFRFLVSILVFVGAAGCASQRPVLYPNEQFKRVGSSAAERDIDDCMRQAEEFVASNGRSVNGVQSAATGAATSATIGAAAGAAGGAVVGRGVTGAAIGAASGGAASAARSVIHGLTGKQNPSPLYKNFVNRCLHDKGYDSLGWQ